MNKLQTLLNKLSDKSLRAQSMALTALMFSPLAAFAQTDPSTDIVAEINKGKGYGIAAAVAFAVAVWAIRGVAMARRKG